MGSMSDEEGAISVIFGPKLFIDLIYGAEELHIDGTFKTRQSRQLLSDRLNSCVLITIPSVKKILVLVFHLIGRHF